MTADPASVPEEGDGPTGTARSFQLRDLATRATLFVLCLLLSVEALAIVSRWRDNRDRLSEILTSQPTTNGRTAEGANEPQTEGLDETLRRVRFERSSYEAKLTVARTLVYGALTHGEAAQLPTARELAAEVLGQQPNNWQASMFLGAATYMDWSLNQDSRLFTSAAEWERPLLQAVDQAGGEFEPRRFLAAAYLETWEVLSAAKRASTLELIKTMFREDPESFQRLGPVWLEVAGDDESALAVIPDLPGPWDALKRSFAGKKDWQAFSHAHDRYLEALRRKLSRDLDDAEQRLRLGDQGGGREICLSVVVSAPRDGFFADQVSRALELYPPGLRGLSRQDALKTWLRWALELYEIGLKPFSPQVIGRLTDAIGDLDSPTGALAALINDDTYGIHRYERLTESMHAREWAPYLIAKSGWLLEREDLAEAEAALAEVHRSARTSAPYWQARRQLARANGDLAQLATAETRLAEIQSENWRASDWLWRGHRATLELQVAEPGRGLELRIDQAPKGGGVVKLMWDGGKIATQPVVQQQSIRLQLEVTPGPHLLELRSLAGGEIQPGAVRLLRD